MGRVLFVDMASQEVYLPSGHKASPDVRDVILKDMKEQQSLIGVTPPLDLVREALNKKKEVMEGANAGYKS